MSIFLIRSKFQYFSYMLDGHFYTSFVNTVHVFPSIFLFIRMFLFLKDAADIQRWGALKCQMVQGERKVRVCVCAHVCLSIERTIVLLYTHTYTHSPSLSTYTQNESVVNSYCVPSDSCCKHAQSPSLPFCLYGFHMTSPSGKDFNAERLGSSLGSPTKWQHSGEPLPQPDVPCLLESRPASVFKVGLPGLITPHWPSQYVPRWLTLNQLTFYSSNVFLNKTVIPS